MGKPKHVLVYADAAGKGSQKQDIKLAKACWKEYLDHEKL